ncbi:MAG: nucleotidyltransferase [Eubacteriales bacterium]
MDRQQITKRYRDAVDAFTDKVRTDPNILAVLVGGSLADNQVWEKSDVDMTVIVRDQKLGAHSYSVDEDGLVLNVSLTTLTQFKHAMGRAKGGGFLHSYYGKGYFTYTADDNLPTLLEEFRVMGRDDIERSFFEYACGYIGGLEKIEKWLTVRDDPLYAQFYVLKNAETMANMKLILSGQPISREAVLKVSQVDPEFIRPFYEVPLSRAMTRQEVWDALERQKSFLDENAGLLVDHAQEYMSDGEIKTVTELCRHFEVDSHSITHVFDYLSELGAVARVSQTIRITPSSRKAVEEIAYIWVPAEFRGK